MEIISKDHKVLVIDDDPHFRNLLVTLLRSEFMVSVAADGLSGFEKACGHPPDIVIVDIQMSGWDGLETIKAFQEHSVLKDTMILVLTSDASQATVMAAINGGANDYLIKTNFNKDELKERLHRLGDRKTRRHLELSRNQRQALADNERKAVANAVEEYCHSHPAAATTAAHAEEQSQETAQPALPDADLEDAVDFWE